MKTLLRNCTGPSQDWMSSSEKRSSSMSCGGRGEWWVPGNPANGWPLPAGPPFPPPATLCQLGLKAAQGPGAGRAAWAPAQRRVDLLRKREASVFWLGRGGRLRISAGPRPCPWGLGWFPRSRRQPGRSGSNISVPPGCTRAPGRRNARPGLSQCTVLITDLFEPLSFCAHLTASSRG